MFLPGQQHQQRIRPALNVTATFLDLKSNDQALFLTAKKRSYNVASL